MLKKAKSTVKKVINKVKSKINPTPIPPLLEQAYQVREMVFAKRLNELMQQTGVVLSLATRDALVPVDLGVQTNQDSNNDTLGVQNEEPKTENTTPVTV